MKPSPFERVLSLKERKEHFALLCSHKSQIIVKSTTNEVGVFTPTMVDKNGDLLGYFRPKSPWKRELNTVNALFYKKSDRYFIKTKLQKLRSQWKLQMSSEFFKLNRRNAFRVQIPTRMDLYFVIGSIRNIEFKKRVRIREISSQGARIEWPFETSPQKNSILRGYIDWGKVRNFEIEAQLIHQPDKEQWGVKFVNMDSVTHNRLKLLCVEVQQILFLG